MNILHLIFSFNNGGSENLVIDILNNWKSKKDKLFLVVVNDVYDSKLLSQIHDNVTIIKLMRKPGSAKFAKVNELKRIISQNRIDVIHCHSNNVFKYALPVLVLFKGKVILTVHNLSIYEEISIFDILLQKMFIDQITAISNSVRDSVLSRGINKSKVTVVYNGLDIEKYKVRKCDGVKKRIVCVGRMVPEIKGQDILIKAMKVVCRERKDVECFFAGGNPTNYDYLKEMRKLASEEGVDSFVTFLGDCHNVPELLSESDLMVVPSRKEGFGLVVIEGMLSKIPVIASNAGGPAELITDHVTGYLFPCEDWNALGNSILNILNSDCHQIIDNAYTYAVKNYSIENTVDNMRQVYLR